ncbi:MAG: 6-bladed beta-propeller [Gracilimonas sp.]|nr:6-bladed beta-propeller [Gracilimonas sp.]
MKPFILLFSLFLIASCNSKKQVETNPLKELSFSKELLLDADNPEILIGAFSGMTVDDQGLIYIADTKLQQIHKFSSEGNYLASIGREGKGPGEFDGLNPAIKIHSNRLFVLQNNAREIDVFDTGTNKHLQTITIENVKIDNKPIGTPRNIFPSDNGNVIVTFVDPYFFKPEDGDTQKLITLSEIDLKGEFINEKLLQVPTPFPTNNRLVYMEDNSINIFTADMYPDLKISSNTEKIVIAKSDSLQFTEYDLAGSKISEVKAQNSLIPFTDSDLDSLSSKRGDKIIKAVNNTGKPDFWPAFEEFIIDTDGRYWIKQHNPWSDTQPWLIIDKSSDAKWTVNLPSDIKLYPGVGGNAYAIQESPSGLASVYRYTFLSSSTD